MRYIDAHAHLQEIAPAGGQEGLLARARQAGVLRIICCATHPGDWDAVAALTARHPDVLVPAFGVHPWHTHLCPPDWDTRLRNLLTRYPAAAIGEIGLDHTPAYRHDTTQRAVFQQQLALACELRRPVCLHCCRAWGNLVDLLAATALPGGFMVHGFAGSVETMQRLCSLGGMLSFSGAILQPRHRKARTALQQVPDAHLLLETDAHGPAADDRRPHDATEPAHLPQIAAGAAALRQTTPTLLAEQTWQNACRFFNLGMGSG